MAAIPPSIAYVLPPPPPASGTGKARVSEICRILNTRVGVSRRRRHWHVDGYIDAIFREPSVADVHWVFRLAIAGWGVSPDEGWWEGRLVGGALSWIPSC